MAKKGKKPDIDAYTKEAMIHNQKYTQLRGRRGAEADLWRDWKKSNDPTKFRELVQSLEPILDSEVRRRSAGLAGSIPPAALKSELRVAMIKGLKNYDPSRGAALTTHLNTQFQAVSDFVASKRNLQRLSKSDTTKYQPYQNVVQDFESNMGRLPTDTEMARELGTTKDTAAGLRRGFAGEVHTFMGGGSTGSADPGAQGDIHRSAVQLIRHQLTEPERRFAEHYFPDGGMMRKTVPEIARILGVPEHKAYRIKKSLQDKLVPVIKRM